MLSGKLENMIAEYLQGSDNLPKLVFSGVVGLIFLLIGLYLFIMVLKGYGSTSLSPLPGEKNWKLFVSPSKAGIYNRVCLLVVALMGLILGILFLFVK
jgi:hypothetical protein